MCGNKACLVCVRGCPRCGSRCYVSLAGAHGCSERICAWTDEPAKDQPLFPDGTIAELPGKTLKAKRRAGRTIGVMLRKHGVATPARTCRDCAHLQNMRCGNSTFQKCKQFGDSSSAATDWRQSWPACGLFEPDTDQVEAPVLFKMTRSGT